MSTNEKTRYPKQTAAEYRLDETELASNPERRAPIEICIDTSFSMRDQNRIEKVLEGLEKFCDDMKKNPIACYSVELSIISYGGDSARVEKDFTSPRKMVIPKLEAEGGTPLADAVNLALENLEQRKIRYNDNGVSFYRPWIIIIGDGDDDFSTKELKAAANKLLEEHTAKHINVLCVAIGKEENINSSNSSLRLLSPDNKVHYLKDMRFNDFFSWLSHSIERVSESLGHEEAELIPTDSWETIL